MRFRRVVARLASAAGLLGIFACISGAFAAWSLGSRLERTKATFFAMIEKGLAATQDRTRSVQERVNESKITATDIDQRLREWETSKTKAELVSRLDIERKTEKLSGHLKTADSWLDISADSIRSVQQIVELGTSVGARLDPATVQEALGDILSLRTLLQQAEQTVDEIGEFAANKASESDELRRSRLTRFLGRVLLTISEIDTRLETAVTRLTELQARAHRAQAKTSAYIRAATIACYLFLAWIAAGQAALCRWGWSNRKRSSQQARGAA